jgi:hypothetical protein
MQPINYINVQFDYLPNSISGCSLALSFREPKETSNAQHPTSNIQVSAFGPSLVVESSMFDVGCSLGS